jgi:hypothetical protein
MWMVHTSHASAALFGQVGSFLDLEFCVPMGVLIGLVAFAIWAVMWIRRWREERIDDGGIAPQEMLDHYQKMVDDGLLDPEEFTRIKARLDQVYAPPADTDLAPPQPDQPPDTSVQEK